MIAITRMTADRISEKMEVKREILVMIAGKQMEAQIMKLMPLAIILYFWVFSPGFLDSVIFVGKDALLWQFFYLFIWQQHIGSIASVVLRYELSGKIKQIGTFIFSYHIVAAFKVLRETVDIVI